MAELVPTATEADWLEARRKGVTASEIAVVMGLSPYSSPYKLWHQKLGILPDDEQAEEQEFGTFCEPYIARKFAGRHPELVLRGDGRELYAHSARPWQLATPDRLVHGRVVSIGDGGHFISPSAVAEFKSDNGSDEWGEPGTDEIPVHYRCQVLWQMDVIGVSRAYVACLGRDRKVREYLIEHDDSPVREYPHVIPGPLASGICRACADIELMHAAARDFLDSIDRKEPPDVDYRPATRAALSALYPDVDEREVHVGRQLAISYRAAVKHAKEAGRRKDEMTARLLEAMGNARRAIEHNTEAPVATRSVSYPRRVDLDTLREKYPEIAAACTPEPKAEVRLLPAKTKKDR